MKKILFLTFLISSSAQAKSFSVDISTDQIKLIETYNPEANQWVKDTVKSQIASLYEQAIRDQMQYCLLNSIPVPPTVDAIVQACLLRLGTWKSRNK